jgi:hypothetical protein
LVTTLALLAAVLWPPSSYGEGDESITPSETPFLMTRDAPIDMSGTWNIILYNSQQPFGKCPLTFTQNDESLSAIGPCAGVQASLTGSTNIATGAFSMSGTAGIFNHEMTGTTDGIVMSGTWSSSLAVGGAFTGGIEIFEDLAKQPEPGDSDKDGCSDQRESDLNETLGGVRDFRNPWDFYDVTGFDGGPKDQIIDLPNDILGVILHYSPDGNQPYDFAFDRGPSTGPNPWNMTAPDGVIDLPNDILGVILQFQHSCQ